MRVLVAGATGAIGTRLVPKLVERGHEVIGTSRSMDSCPAPPHAGSRAGRPSTCWKPARCAGGGAGREAGRHHPPGNRADRPGAISSTSTGASAQTNLLRTEGTDALLAAAKEVGVSRIIAQSFTLRGTRVRAGRSRPRTTRSTRRRWRRCARPRMRWAYLDRVVTEAGGIALRYGGFYGDPSDTTLIDAVRAGKFPIVGSGEGRLVVHPPRRRGRRHRARARPRGPRDLQHRRRRARPHQGVAARAGRGSSARSLLATSPRWLARMVTGEALVMMSTEARGASNAKAKRELDWTPAPPHLATGLRGRLRRATGRRVRDRQSVGRHNPVVVESNELDHVADVRLVLDSAGGHLGRMRVDRVWSDASLLPELGANLPREPEMGGVVAM